jgi:SNF2 family DNA or RNA helicase
MNRGYFGLFMEQGTGKSWVTLATIAHLFLRKEIDGVLILAPNGVHQNWTTNEIPIHLHGDIEDQASIKVWSSPMGVRAKNEWDWTCNSDDAPLIILSANIEAIRTDCAKSMLAFCKRRKVMIVIDESTVIKNPKALQTKNAIALAKFAFYTRILTGTPITQSPLDLWAMSRFLSVKALPFNSWTAFKAQFANEEVISYPSRNISFKKITGYKNQELLAEHVAKYTYRVLKKDCLDLPEKLYTVRFIELTPEQKKIYRDLVDKHLAMLKPGEMVTIATALTLMLRLQQVVMGYVPADDGPIHRIKHNRLTTLMETLEEVNGKAIIFCRFIEDIEQIHEALKDTKHVLYYGATSSSDREAAIKSFQEDPDTKYFIASKAASKGLTLTAANTVIYYSQDFSLEARLQSEDRAHRIGQRNSVLYIDFVATKTVDEKIVLALKAKQDLANSVLNAEAFRDFVSLG